MKYFCQDLEPCCNYDEIAWFCIQYSEAYSLQLWNIQYGHLRLANYPVSFESIMFGRMISYLSGYVLQTGHSDGIHGEECTKMSVVFLCILVIKILPSDPTLVLSPCSF